MRMLSAAVIGLSFTASAFAALSKSYEPVRVEIGGVVPIAFGDPVLKGIGLMVEPKVNITDQISAGLRAEIGALLGGSSGADENSASVGAMAFRAYIAKGEYFFNTNEIRPFAGIGAGLYTVGAVNATAEATSTSASESASAIAGNYFGFVPSFGANFNSFRLAAGLNMIFAKEQLAKSSANTNGQFSTTYEEKTKLRPVLSIEFAGSINSKKKETAK